MALWAVTWDRNEGRGGRTGRYVETEAEAWRLYNEAKAQDRNPDEPYMDETVSY